MFHVKQAHDTFSTKRKVLIIEILTILSYEYRISGACDLCMESLKSKKAEVVFAAREYLEKHGERNNHSVEGGNSV